MKLYRRKEEGSLCSNRARSLGREETAAEADTHTEGRPYEHTNMTWEEDTGRSEVQRYPQLCWRSKISRGCTDRPCLPSLPLINYASVDLWMVILYFGWNILFLFDQIVCSFGH